MVSRRLGIGVGEIRTDALHYIFHKFCKPTLFLHQIHDPDCLSTRKHAHQVLHMKTNYSYFYMQLQFFSF